MTEVKIYKSRRKARVMILAGLAAGAAGGLAFHFLQDSLLGWCLIIAAVFILVYGAGSWSDLKPQLILTERGLTELFTMREEIEWEAIMGVDDFFYRGQDFVRLILPRSYKPDLLRATWFRRLDGIYAQDNVKAMYVRVSGLSINAGELTGIVRAMAGAAPSAREELLAGLDKAVRDR